jgi:hypothetical protein
MAFCAKCGTQLNDGVAYCPSCGASTGSSPSAPPPPPPFEPAPSASYAYAGAAPSLVSRVQNILMKPKVEWPVIEREQTNVAALYSGYIALLAALPVIASFIKSSLIGTTMFFTTFRTPIVRGLVGSIIQYALSLAGVYLAAFIIDKLAPNFNSQSNFMQALKLVAYASTAAWIAGLANIIPILGILVAIAGGFYSVYLFYLGLPLLMKTPADKIIVYMIVSAVIIFVIYIVIGMVVGAMMYTTAITSHAITGY